MNICFLFLPHSNVGSNLELNRSKVKWNLFVNEIKLVNLTLSARPRLIPEHTVHGRLGSRIKNKTIVYQLIDEDLTHQCR